MVRGKTSERFLSPGLGAYYSPGWDCFSFRSLLSQCLLILGAGSHLKSYLFRWAFSDPHPAFVVHPSLTAAEPWWQGLLIFKAFK